MNARQRGFAVNTLLWLSLVSLVIALFPVARFATEAVATKIHNATASEEFHRSYAKYELAHASWWKSLTDEQRDAWRFLQTPFDPALRLVPSRDPEGREIDGKQVVERLRRGRAPRSDPGSGPLDARWQRVFDMQLAMDVLKQAPSEPKIPRYPELRSAPDAHETLVWWFGLPVTAAAWWVRRWIMLS